MNKSLPQRPENGPKRITWGLIGRDILNVLNFEKGVLFTIKGLLFNPGVAVNDYLYGNRSLHANPLRFLIISTAIVSLLNYYLILKPSLERAWNSPVQTEEGSSNEIGKEFGQNLTLELNLPKSDSTSENYLTLDDDKPAVKLEKGEEKRIVKESMKVLFQWMDKFTFASVPIFTFFTFLFFRRSGYNFTENLVINAFMVSMTNIFGILLLLPTFYYRALGGAVLALITVGYIIFYLKRVFALPGFKGYLRAIATMILSYAFYVVIIGATLIYLVVDYVQALGL